MEILKETSNENSFHFNVSLARGTERASFKLHFRSGDSPTLNTITLPTGQKEEHITSLNVIQALKRILSNKTFGVSSIFLTPTWPTVDRSYGDNLYRGVVKSDPTVFGKEGLRRDGCFLALLNQSNVVHAIADAVRIIP
jgi:hypothetical protein